ncbi:MAG: protein kinase [Planctomycetes bacterium]|nr:protein kinase [Planctomycetota bacterium]
MQEPAHTSEFPGRDDPLMVALTEELVERWAKGERIPVEELLDRYPQLWEEPAKAVELIYEEISLRSENGESNAAEQVLERFPQWRQQLEVMVECHRLLETPLESQLPETGETVAGFHLLEELGRGARGRVFLASEPALADRPCVLKITPLDGREHLNLARLQHTHIVTLYAVHDDPVRNLRLLCMPYFGGTTLDRLLGAFAAAPTQTEAGARFLELLNQGGLEASGPAKQMLARLSFVEAICWIGSCLADALHYAHGSGLVHLDVKPANALMAADGQPMLLDFHLAHKALNAGEHVLDGLGGTPGYMAPEHSAALNALARGNPIPNTVDCRADIYSLGAMLYEALGGRLPFDAALSQPLYRINPAVTRGLSDIVERCLSPAAQDRYAAGLDLAEDMRRHMHHEPLRGVRNRSIRERLTKWRRRRPTALRVFLMVLFLLGALGAASYGFVAHWNQQRQEAERALAEGRRDAKSRGRHEEAIERLKRGRELVLALPFHDDLVRQFDEELAWAMEAKEASLRRQALREIHDLAERMRALVNVEGIPFGQLATLERSCSELWSKSAQLANWSEFAESPEAQADLLDLALFSIQLQVELAPPEKQEAARINALKALDDVEARFGTSPVLNFERTRHRDGGHQSVAKLPRGAAKSAWEHCVFGRAYLQANELDRAAWHLRQALAEKANAYWPNYYLGLCSHRQGQYTESTAAFSVCIGAAPDVAAAYFNRAQGYAALKIKDLALADYDRALRLDGNLAPAALNRGMLHYESKRFQEAEADLRRALDLGMNPAMVHFNLALVSLARANPVDAKKHLQQTLSREPGHKQARELWNVLGSAK